MNSTAMPVHNTNDTALPNLPSLPAIPNSAVAWGAIAAGGAAAASLSLILLILGVGLGLSSISPWTNTGIQVGTLGLSTILWLTLTQLLASALGGYLAGRLRTRWEGLHRDEVYFRDTAHGFLSWAVAALATAVLLTSVIGSILGTSVQAGASALGGAGAVAAETALSATGRNDANNSPMGYFIDTLFRRDADTNGTDGNQSVTNGTNQDANRTVDASTRTEVSRIFMHASRTEPLPAEDVRYVGQLIASRTSISQANAEKRVVQAYTQAQAKLNEAETNTREMTDKARKASAYAALWLFVSLLAGAFVASWTATLGGRERDNY